MLKSLTLLSVSAVTLLASTQAYSHILCAPNNPQVNVSHAHNQAYTVPRIQPVVRHVVARPVHNQQTQKHMQAQRARQQQALANQRRVNQQRRAQAQRIQQQVAARKAQQIRQQQAAAQRARAARQQAAQRAARFRQPVQQAVYRQPAQRVVYRQPAPQVTYYQAPAAVVQYVPARTSVSLQVNTARRVHSHTPHNVRHVNRALNVMHYPSQPLNYQCKHNQHCTNNWHK